MWIEIKTALNESAMTKNSLKEKNPKPHRAHCPKFQIEKQKRPTIILTEILNHTKPENRENFPHLCAGFILSVFVRFSVT
jgi:hypothetical protein